MKRIALALIAALAAARATAVSPPQYRQQRLIRASVGANPFVAVGEVVEVSGSYRVDVTCASLDVARGVSFLLKKEYDFGGLRLTVRVLDEHGAVADVDESSIGGDPVVASRELLRTALAANPLFDSFASGPFAPLVVLVRPEVVQFWNDNLADPAGNESLLAAEAFAACARESVLGGAVRPAWSTGAVASSGGRFEGYLPAVAHAPGQFGSEWTTDLRVVGARGTTVRIWFHAAGRDNGGAAAASLPLTGAVTAVSDVLGTLFHADGHGALRYSSDGPVRVVSRTWTPSGAGTTGLFTPDLALAEAARGGTSAATLLMTVDQRAGFRANLGLVSASGFPVALVVEVLLADGTAAPGSSSFTVSLPPFGMTQENDVLARLAPGERRGLLVRARVLTPGGAAFAFLSEVDNETNSPAYQPAMLR